MQYNSMYVMRRCSSYSVTTYIISSAPWLFCSHFVTTNTHSTFISIYTYETMFSSSNTVYKSKHTFEFSYWQLTYSEQEVFRTTNRRIHCSFCSHCTQKKFPHSWEQLQRCGFSPVPTTLFITTVELKNEGFCDLTSHNQQHHLPNIHISEVLQGGG